MTDQVREEWKSSILLSPWNSSEVWPLTICCRISWGLCRDPTHPILFPSLPPQVLILNATHNNPPACSVLASILRSLISRCQCWECSEKAYAGLTRDGGALDTQLVTKAICLISWGALRKGPDKSAWHGSRKECIRWLSDLYFFGSFLETRSHYIVQAALELPAILLPHLVVCWDYMHETKHLVCESDIL